jgi:hypothetical protein
MERRTAMDHQFRTKTGICTITQSRIVITRQGVRGTLTNIIFGTSILRGLVIYGVLGAASLAEGAWDLLRGDMSGGVLFSLLGTYFLWTAIANRNNSAAPIIERSTIRSIEAHPPLPPVTRGYFMVYFEEGGRARGRRILLPGTLEGGDAEYVLAVAMFKELGLLK